jgi:hypothetical protein
MIERALMNPGVISGLGVTATSGLTWQVGEGVAAVSRGAADGLVLAYTPAATVQASAGPASGSRIDRLWVRQHDPDQGDADNLVEVGVTEGTAAASPTAPSIPAGAQEIRRFLVPSGMTATTSATPQGSINWATPYGGTLGALIDYTDTDNGTAHFDKDYVILNKSFYVPTKRLVSAKIITTCVSCDQSGALGTTPASLYQKLLVDGSQIIQWEQDLPIQIAGARMFEWSFTVAAGTHTLKYIQNRGVGNAFRHYYSANGWAGTRVQLIDEGVSA